MSEIAAFENLFLAFRKAARGKRGHSEVAAFELDLEHQLIDLRQALLSRTYRPGPYRSFRIHDPKERLISAAPFRDRVVHHALCRQTEPLFERRFIGDSYANRLGKGTHRAIDRAQAFARRYRYVLQCDLREFFASIDHAVLLETLDSVVRDEGAAWLAGEILAGGAAVHRNHYTMVYFPGDDLFAIERPRGLPIGNLTSQVWANVYLDRLDQFVKRRLRCRAYVRYVDDFLLFSDSKAELWAWKRAVRERLAALRLALHERRSTVFPVAQGIPFLGFRVFPDRKRLLRRNGVAFARRLAKLREASTRGEIPVEQVFERIRGWVAHASHGDTLGLRRSLLGKAWVPCERAG